MARYKFIVVIEIDSNEDYQTVYDALSLDLEENIDEPWTCYIDDEVSGEI